MTTLEVIFLIIIWIIIGVWISYKRQWYKSHYDKEEFIFTNILLSPVVLLIVIFKYFIVAKWE